jgi:serine/threonine protein kinase/Tfp pilus assembly protein PilF
VAIKMLGLGIEEASQRSFLLDRLLRDAKAAAILSHPNIVSIYDVIEEYGTAYVVMEYVPGGSLASFLEGNPTSGIELTLQVLRQMASALDYTHSKGVIHRDIKPGNVMRDPNGVVKILDFGIARISDGLTSTPTSMVMGTVEYMSPEQLKGDAVDGRADQFSLAAVAYRMLTGSTLFGLHTVATIAYKVVNEMPPPPTQRNSLLPPAVDRVLMRALAKSPSERFQTCCEFSDALTQAFMVKEESRIPQAAKSVPVNGPTVPHQSNTDSLNKTPRVMAWVAAIVCIAMAAIVLLVWRPWNHPPVVVKTETSPAVPTSRPAPSLTNPSPPPPVQEQQLPQRASNADAAAKSHTRMAATDVTSKSDRRALVTVPNVNAGQPNNPQLDRQYRNGRQQIKDGDLVGAIQSFTAVILIDPKFRRAYHERGYAHQLAHQPLLAIQDFSQAVQIDPKDAMSYADRAVCLAHMRQDDQAMADFARALQLRPDLAAALNGRGAILLKRRDYPEAIRNFDAAIASKPKFAPAYANRAKARRALGDISGAQADFRKAEELKASLDEAEAVQ